GQRASRLLSTGPRRGRGGRRRRHRAGRGGSGADDGPPVRPPGLLRRGQLGGGTASAADPGAAPRLARVAGGRAGESRSRVVREGRLLRGARGPGGSYRLASALWARVTESGR